MASSVVWGLWVQERTFLPPVRLVRQEHKFCKLDTNREETASPAGSSGRNVSFVSFFATIEPSLIQHRAGCQGRSGEVFLAKKLAPVIVLAIQTFAPARQAGQGADVPVVSIRRQGQQA